jgi:hypothetical protein
MELVIQHQREHGQRMIELALDMSEHCRNSFQGETAGNLCVFIHIQVVVVIDKVVPQRLAEDYPDNSRQKNADPNNRPAITQTSRTAFGFRQAGVCHSRHFTNW